MIQIFWFSSFGITVKRDIDSDNDRVKKARQYFRQSSFTIMDDAEIADMILACKNIDALSVLLIHYYWSCKAPINVNMTCNDIEPELLNFLRIYDIKWSNYITMKYKSLLLTYENMKNF